MWDIKPRTAVIVIRARITYAFIKYIIGSENAIIINLGTPECLVVWQIIIGFATRGATLLSFHKTLAQDLVVSDVQ